MIRRHISPSSSSSFLLPASSTLLLSSAKRTIFSGMDSPSSSFLNFSSMTEKAAEQKKPKPPSFRPYHKDHLSSQKFHWKEPVKRMLKELEKNKMKPTHRVSNWSLHDPVEPLLKQHAIEYKYLRQIVENPANHSFQKDAFNATRDFVADVFEDTTESSNKQIDENNNNSSSSSNSSSFKCKTFTDIVKFRVRHGVATPGEIYFALDSGFINESDLSFDQEALHLVKQLTPHTNSLMANFVGYWYITSALCHASQTGFNTGKNPAEFAEIADYLPFGSETLYDRTDKKMLVRTDGVSKPNPSSADGTREYQTGSHFYAKRLQRVKDWTKAKIIFIDLPSLDRTLSDPVTTFLQCSYTTPTDPQLKPENLFLSSADNEIFETSTLKSISLSKFTSLFTGGTKNKNKDEDENNNDNNTKKEKVKIDIDKHLNRWHHMLCVPKISSIALVTATNYSDTVIKSLHKKMEEDPNLIVVFQHVPNSGLDDIPNPNAPSSTANFGGVPDMNYVEQVLLRSLPIHGYTTTPGWQGAISWVEDVLKDELGFPLDTIPVSAVNSQPTCNFWGYEPGTNSLSQQEDGMFVLEDPKFPKFVFDTYWPGKGNLGEFPSIPDAAIEALGFPRNSFIQDCCPILEVMYHETGRTNFWRGTPMPTTRNKLMTEKAEDGKSLKWWSKVSNNYPYNN